MLLLLVLAPPFVPESRNPQPGLFDLISAALSLVAMLPFVYGIKHAATGGGALESAIAIAAGLTIGVLFFRRQRRLAEPMIDVGLFANQKFTGALLGNLVAVFATAGGIFFVAQYLLLVVDMSPVEAGTYLMPGMLTSIVGGFIAVWLVKRIAVNLLVPAALLFTAAGFLSLGWLSPTSGGTPVAVAFVLIVLGASAASILTNDIITSSVPAERSGQAAAISETSYELGTALGTAVLGSLLLGIYRGELSGHAKDVSGASAALIEKSQQSLGAAFDVASGLSGTAGTQLREIADQAFTAAANMTSLIAAAITLIVALAGSFTLRGAEITPTEDSKH